MSRRHKARELLVQALYASEVGKQPLADAVTDQIERRAPREEGLHFVQQMLPLLDAQRGDLDAAIDAALTGWAPERVSVVERCILRLAICELRMADGTPAGVVFNEAVELARDFSGDEAGAFVHGVLDRVHRGGEAAPAS